MKFGTDGVRGPFGPWPISEDGAARIGGAVALHARGPVLVARDTRPSSPALADAVCRGVVRAGGQAWDAGVLPSGGLSAAVAVVPGAWGVMVTASHNPAPDNGFKVLTRGGFKPDDDAVTALEASLASDPPARDGGSVQARGPWAAEVVSAAMIAAVGDLTPLAGRRLVIDLANGAATAIAPRLFDDLGLDVVLVGGGGGEILDGVGSEHPAALCDAVRAHGAVAGIALDGDGDRALLVDASGAVVPGDAVTALLAGGLGVSGLAVTVMSTAAFPAWLPGVHIVRTPVGDRHLVAALRRGEATLGGEDSGHVVFADGLPGGDGLVTGLRALACAFRDAPSLAAAVAPFVPWPRVLTKVAAPERRDLAMFDAHVARGETSLGDGGRVFLRYSGTEPALRILVEGRDAATVAAVSAEVTAACRAALA